MVVEMAESWEACCRDDDTYCGVADAADGDDALGNNWEGVCWNCCCSSWLDVATVVPSHASAITSIFLIGIIGMLLLLLLLL